MPAWLKQALVPAAIACTALGLYSALPSLNGAVFASPDETATFVSAFLLQTDGTAAMPIPDAISFPWLHPRSYASLGPSIVPVGFLGWPWILSWLDRLSLAISPWAGAVLLASSAFPLFFLLQRFGERPAILGTVVAMTAPAMVLYGNRGLFPNAASLAFVVWAVWLVVHVGAIHELPLRRGLPLLFLAGLFGGAALAIRPVEAAWFVPWIVWAWSGIGRDAKRIAAFAVGALLVCIGVAVAAHATYGSWFQIGYWLRDNATAPAAGASSMSSLASHVAPFGIHPKNIAANLVWFGGGILFPWLAVLLAAGTVLFVNARRAKAKLPLMWWLSAWTVAWLVLFYGNGRYLDNINGTVTIGNSYIRYLLPLMPLVGLVVAWFAAHPFKHKTWAIVTVAVLLSVAGTYRAYAGDEEGVFQTRKELIRYASVRAQAQERFEAGSVVFSDRSDKIFFPDMLGVSPLPSVEQMARYVTVTARPAGLYARPLTQSDRDAWRRYGVEVQDVGSSGRERLYVLAPRP